MDEFTFNARRLWRLCKKCAMQVHHGPTPPSLDYADRTARFLFEIAAQESSLRWERQRSPDWAGQVGGFSKWQMEKGFVEGVQAYLKVKAQLAQNVADFVFCDPKAPPLYLAYLPIEHLLCALRFNDNDALGAALCRCGILQWPEQIPPTLEGRAALWKRRYNTAQGKGAVEEYIRNAQRLCLPVIEKHPLQASRT